jgi:MFS family permease
VTPGQPEDYSRSQPADSARLASGRPSLRDLVLAESSFGRLAVTHALMLGGSTMVAVALAGSLFFSISPTAAQSRVALYLVLTMLPFAFVAPALGPALDRSKTARRGLAVTAAAAQAILCLLMASSLNSLVLFPEALGLLVASKLYLVAKSALVPTTVNKPAELVKANSRLAVISGVSGFAVGAPAAGILKLAGAPWVLRLDVVVFALAALAAARLPKPSPTWTGDGEASGLVPHVFAPITVIAAAAMAVLRGSVGFLTFALAFVLRRHHAATWEFGLMLAASGVGGLAGSLLAPRLGRVLTEQRILVAALGAAGLASLIGGIGNAIWSDVVMVFGVGMAATSGKMAFDAIVQREAPEATRGRSFARFETRFQLAWVIGGLVPLLVAIPSRDAAVAVAVAAAVAAASYSSGRRALIHQMRLAQSGDPAPGSGQSLGAEPGIAAEGPSWIRLADVQGVDQAEASLGRTDQPGDRNDRSADHLPAERPNRRIVSRQAGTWKVKPARHVSGWRRS